MGPKKNFRRGFTLVELMVVVAIIGILAALAVYGVRRYLMNAKMSEARTVIGAIAKASTMAYDRETIEGGLLPSGQSSTLAHALCGGSTVVPTSTDMIRGMKYQSNPAEWGGNQTVGWSCLMFKMEAPQYYMYQYTSPGTNRLERSAANAESATFIATATGDLDGDGHTSTFSLAGAVIEENNDTQVKVSPSIAEGSPGEV